MDTAAASFEDLLAEGAAVPVDSWDFSWFAGRASEERPPWGYAGLVAQRLGRAQAVLDVQTGGGEVLAFALGRAGRRPGRVAATEPYAPNLALARDRLGPFGGTVEPASDDGALPFADDAFDLVVSRHPVVTPWDEIARVLEPGGTVLTQQVGPGSNGELIELLMGPQPVGSARHPERAVPAAEHAGLEVVDRREARCRVELGDVGAVVHFLRKVPWTVPGFTVDAYRDRLLGLHEVIGAEGPFVCHSTRFLLEARAVA